MPWIGSINCNFRDYNEGVFVTYAGKSYELTWRWRETRLAQLLRLDGQCSLYAVSECDTEMMKGLCTRLGTTWKHIGGDNYYTDVTDDDAHDKNGWLFDSSKWSWDAFINYPLPDGGTRHLLGAKWKYLANGETLNMFNTHYDSGNPTGRALQSARVLEVIGNDPCVFAGDLNASSYNYDPALAENRQGPRVQLQRAGWLEAPYQAGTPTFQDYGRSTGSRIDYFGASPSAAAAGITISQASIVDGLNPPSGTGSALGSDHNLIKALVSF